MLNIRDVQTGKLKEFNEVPKIKNETGEKRQKHGLGGEGAWQWAAHPYMEPNRNDGLLLCECSYYAESYNEQRIPCACTRLRTNEHREAIRTCRLKPPNERSEYKMDKEQLSITECSSSRTLASISQPCHSCLHILVHMLETCLLFSTQPEARRREAAGKHWCQVKNASSTCQLFRNEVLSNSFINDTGHRAVLVLYNRFFKVRHGCFWSTENLSHRVFTCE